VGAGGRFFEEPYELKTGRPELAARGLEDRMQADQASLYARVAKGVDALALRIRAVAEENDVPVVENPPLARALHAAIEIDEPVPAEHFKAVAQVIGYVMRLQGKLPARAS
jgi:flagellar biosynthesis protein FlhB